MGRAHRQFLPGYYWHITHRCHQREFLFKFAQDRKVWMRWLYEARVRYGLVVLNYTVTSNHIHLLVRSEGEEVAPSLQLLAGATAQQYNRRKSRKGAFWEDRYHATAVESGQHLVNCMLYIDMNMVRAGVVTDPLDWPESGCHEILKPHPKYRNILIENLLETLEFDRHEELVKTYREWQKEALAKGQVGVDWSGSVAVGSGEFVEEIKGKLGMLTERRKVYPVEVDGGVVCELREDSGYFSWENDAE